MSKHNQLCLRADALMREIEAEMRKLRLWTEGPKPPGGRGVEYLGLSYEQWFQFYYLPSLRLHLCEGTLGCVPAVRIGVGAVRHFEQGPDSDSLIRACAELEELVATLPSDALTRTWQP